MGETSTEVVRRYLEDAIAAEKSFESQYENFAKEGDDEEVLAAFRAHAAETRTQYERLVAHLEGLGGSASSAKSFMAHLFGPQPKSPLSGHGQEERTVQNLITAFTIEGGECAMYETLAAIAMAAGDSATESLAREIQAEEKQAAEKFWQFIPTRSKIALNVLTLSEIDPAVETKAEINRVVTR